MHLRTYYPTVVLSDIHLGTSHSKTIEVSNFLKSVNCDRLDIERRHYRWLAFAQGRY